MIKKCTVALFPITHSPREWAVSLHKERREATGDGMNITILFFIFLFKFRCSNLKVPIMIRISKIYYY